MTDALHDTVTAALAAARETLAGGTPGPWLSQEMGRMYVGNQADGREHGLWEIVYAGEPLADLKSEYAARERADAALIVTAVNSLGASLDLIAMVVEGHAPRMAGSRGPFCFTCHRTTMASAPLWPCVLYRQAAAALGLEVAG